MSDIYVVLSVCLIIWFSLFGYLFALDKKVQNLKKMLEND